MQGETEDIHPGQSRGRKAKGEAMACADLEIGKSKRPSRATAVAVVATGSRDLMRQPENDMEILLTLVMAILTIATFLCVAVPIAALFWIIIEIGM